MKDLRIKKTLTIVISIKGAFPLDSRKKKR